MITYACTECGERPAVTLTCLDPLCVELSRARTAVVQWRLWHDAALRAVVQEFGRMWSDTLRAATGR